MLEVKFKYGSLSSASFSLIRTCYMPFYHTLLRIRTILFAFLRHHVNTYIEWNTSRETNCILLIACRVILGIFAVRKFILVFIGDRYLTLSSSRCIQRIRPNLRFAYVLRFRSA
jgi:hypothetical protein